MIAKHLKAVNERDYRAALHAEASKLEDIPIIHQGFSLNYCVQFLTCTKLFQQSNNSHRVGSTKKPSKQQ